MLKRGLVVCLMVGSIFMLDIMAYAQYSREEVEKKVGIGNCHSYTYWKLTGDIIRDVSYETLTALLKNKLLYKETRWSIHSDYGPTVKLEPGDVVTFGYAHSGFVLFRGRVSHLRKTQFQNIDPYDHSIYPNLAITIPIDPERLSSYPHDYIAYLKKQGVSQEAIDEKLNSNPPSIGFYHPYDTIEDIKKIPAYRKLQVTVWKQPKELKILPQEKKISKDDETNFKAYLIYEHSTEKIEADKLTEVHWQPMFADKGGVSGEKAGIGRHEIKAVAPKIPKPWGIHSKFVRKTSKGRLFHDKYKDTAVLIVEEKSDITEELPDIKRSDATELTTMNWYGTWECTGPPPEILKLTIGGEGKSSNLTGYYPRAHGGRPANATYTIAKISEHTAEGRYVYYDSNPNRGPTGQPGVWTGSWSITILGNELKIFIADDASGWTGTYICRKYEDGVRSFIFTFLIYGSSRF